jgi:rare lipoprotein A
MNPSKLTAAHKSLRFGTKLRVTNSRNGKAVVVRINDRGPFIRGRVLDLSRAAANQIGMVRSGTAKVCYEIIG